MTATVEQMRKALGEQSVPQRIAFRALCRAILDRHRPFLIYDECGHDHTYEDYHAGRCVEVDEIGYVCEDGHWYDVCRVCCGVDRNGGEQPEDCATFHDHPGPDDWPCPDVQAVEAALRQAGWLK